MRAAVCALAAVALGSVAPTPSLSGQKPPARSHFWLEIGAGWGGVRIGCGGCPDVTTASGSISHLRLGGSITDNVLLGVEAFGFSDEEFSFSDDDSTVVAENSSLAAVVLWYPWRNGIFLKGGVGIAGGRFTVQPDSGEAVIAEGEGVGLTFGVGYDFPLSRRFALTANLAAYITAIGDISLNGRVVDDVIPTLYQVGIGFTFR